MNIQGLISWNIKSALWGFIIEGVGVLGYIRRGEAYSLAQEEYTEGRGWG